MAWARYWNKASGEVFQVVAHRLKVGAPEWELNEVQVVSSWQVLPLEGVPVVRFTASALEDVQGKIRERIRSKSEQGFGVGSAIYTV